MRRASQILLAVATQADGLTARSISDRFGLALPTTYHLLATLTDEGLLSKDARRHYLIGPSAVAIAQAVERDETVPTGYLEPLEQLAEKTGEPSYVSAWRRGRIVVLMTAEGTHPVRVSLVDVGYSDNMHARASGKLLLAFAREDVRDRVLAELPLPALTPNTITDRNKLVEELEEIRQAKISYDRQELIEGVECVSAPIYQGNIVVACFTVSAPSARFKAQRDSIESALRIATAAAGTTRS